MTRVVSKASETFMKHLEISRTVAHCHSKFKHFFNTSKHNQADVQPGGGLVLGLVFYTAQSTAFWVLKDLRVRMTQHPRGIHQW